MLFRSEYMISHLNSFCYVELDGEFIETPFQHFEEVSPEIAATKTVSFVPLIAKLVPWMSYLKDAKAVIEEGRSTIWVSYQTFLSNQINLAWVSLLLLKRLYAALGLEGHQ